MTNPVVIGQTFTVFDRDGTEFGRGCFSYRGSPGAVTLSHPSGGAAGSVRVENFWYHDSVVGTLGLLDLKALTFSTDGAARFSFEAERGGQIGIAVETVSKEHAGKVSAHRGAAGDFANQGRTVAFPRENIVPEGELIVPAVDLVVLIDTSFSMMDEAQYLSNAVSVAIDMAKSNCPSDLRVSYLGVEGWFTDTKFDQSARSYLTTKGTAKGKESELLQRTKEQVEKAGLYQGSQREDGARAMQDVVRFYDWRPNAQKAIFYLTDEALEGGSGIKDDDAVDAEDIAAANNAIKAAKEAKVRLHTYMGKTWLKKAGAELLRAELARVANETGGQAFAYAGQDAYSTGSGPAKESDAKNLAADDPKTLADFQSMLQKVICGSRAPAPEPVVEEREALIVPKVDLVIGIDTSASMVDEAKELSEAVSAAIDAASKHCPSDLRVVYLGLEGTFKGTKFDKTARDYLTKTVKVDEAKLRQRKRGTVAEGGAQEDGARLIEDIATLFDWRPEARRAMLYLSDEGLEGGGRVDEEDIAAATQAITVAQRNNMRVHTYLGDVAYKKADKDKLAAEFKRVAEETGGQAFTKESALAGLKDVLEKVICGSKQKYTVTTPCCPCCQELVTGFKATPATPNAVK